MAQEMVNVQVTVPNLAMLNQVVLSLTAIKNLISLLQNHQEVRVLSRVAQNALPNLTSLLASKMVGMPQSVVPVIVQVNRYNLR